ncbi:hypothetical protein [Bradyrhizobium sp. STM 3557]|uniref:hypothetical protein n=1 Tax=Bradyrhizobium sp. STM 3557 TaxID=578920 RepID=UPI003890D795
MTALKIRENRLRRRLAKADHRLAKMPARSWLRQAHAPGYMVLDHTNTVRIGCSQWEYDATLSEAEAFAGTL